MSKTFGKTILWILGTLVVLYFGLSLLMSWQLSSSHKNTWEEMSKTDLNCPPNTEPTTRGWSKAGYMRYCEPKRNGVWEAWSEGYRHVLGEYKNGIKHGKWKSFDKNGTIKTITTYENGKEIDIKEVNK